MKIKEFLGMLVLDSNANEVGKIVDADFDKDSGKLTKIGVSLRKNILSSSLVEVDFDDIKSIGDYVLLAIDIDKEAIIKEKAKKEQVPADVIQRSIDKVNKGVGEDYTVCEYEAFGPAGSNMIIKCLTDNVNRTVASIKTVANKSAAKIATQGAVSFMYENLCVIGVKGKSEDEVMEALINADVDVNDIEVDGDLVLAYAEPSNYSSMKKAMEDALPGVSFEVDEIGKYAKDMVTLEGDDLEAFKKILNLLDEDHCKIRFRRTLDEQEQSNCFIKFLIELFFVIATFILIFPGIFLTFLNKLNGCFGLKKKEKNSNYIIKSIFSWIFCVIFFIICFPFIILIYSMFPAFIALFDYQ